MSEEETKAEKDPKDVAQWEAVEEAVELVMEERYREALAFLRAVLDKDPRNAYAFHYVGVALYESGELEPSRDAYRAALKIAPKYAGARVALSHVLRQLGDYPDAIKEGTIALNDQPGDADALYATGMAYYARGDMPAAKRHFQAFLQARPEFETATEVKGLLDAIEQGLV